MKNLQDIDVYILCGGLGKRLRSAIKDKPKSMASFGDKIFLDILIDHFAGFGCRRFILGVGFKSKKISDHYRRYPRKDLKIIFVKESQALGTGGALVFAKNKFKSSNFFVCNGDSYSEFNPQRLLEFHLKRKADISILLRKITKAQDFGSLKIDKIGKVIDFCEKNNSGKISLVNSGCYIFNKKVFSTLPKKKVFSLEYDLFQNNKVKMFGFINKGFFIDIGTPERYSQAKRYFKGIPSQSSGSFFPKRQRLGKNEEA